MRADEPHQSVGTLRFDEAASKITVEVDPAIVALTRALFPPALRAQVRPQKYAPHITLVREEPLPRFALDPLPGSLALWLCDGKAVRFFYDPSPVVGDTYVWLRVFSLGLRWYRRERLGLPPTSPLTRPPNGEDCFHITLGNRKPDR